MAEINGTKYPTLADAVKAAQPGATITLLKDASGDGIGTFATPTADQTAVKDFTLDLGGFTYTASSPYEGSTGTQNQGFHLEKGGNVTIKNGTLTTGGGARFVIQNYCNLTLTDVHIDGSNLDSALTPYAVSNNCGTVIINGNSSILPKEWVL